MQSTASILLSIYYFQQSSSSTNIYLLDLIFLSILNLYAAMPDPNISVPSSIKIHMASFLFIGASDLAANQSSLS